MGDKALAGLKVLEWASFIAGPYCGKLFADMGAEVIKIERPGVGDEARQRGPFPDHIPHPEKSGLFLYLNSNKLGITLDVETATGQKILKELLKTADILIEDHTPAAMEKLGLDYPNVQKVNPALVMVSITAFGQTGPYKDYKGYAINSSALGGQSVCAGEPGREPLTPPLCLGHYQSGAAGATAAMAALFARESSGKGQQVDISEAQVWATLHTGNQETSFIMHSMKRMRWGHRTPGVYPYTILPCKDGFMSMIAIQGYQWKRFLELIGDGKVPEWYASEPRFQDRRELSLKYADEMDGLLAPWLMSHTKQQIYELCLEKRVPFAPVKNMAEVVNDSHLKTREYFVEADHPTAGTLKYPGAPGKFSETPWAIESPAPLLGQHNEEIYCERLGYGKEELAELRTGGII
ncbi:MAG: CoA transferase [Dehalococcoidia bacterium]|nr:CoA transferase [Dehalococcoidia bacterium]